MDSWNLKRSKEKERRTVSAFLAFIRCLQVCCSGSARDPRENKKKSGGRARREKDVTLSGARRARGIAFSVAARV